MPTRPCPGRLALIAIAAAASLSCREADSDATGGSATSAVEVERAAATITANDLRRHLAVVAADSMLGRDTPSPGLLRTARYAEETFRSLGLEPGLAEGFLQFYPVRTIRLGDASRQSLVIRGPGGVHALTFGSEWFASPSARQTQVDAGLITVGDPRDPASLAGHFALTRVGYPDLRLLYGKRLQGILAERGAVGSLVALDVRQESFEGIRRRAEDEQAWGTTSEQAWLPTAYVAYSALPRELAGVLSRGEAVPEGWSAELRTEPIVRGAQAPNVVAVLPGSDPVLRKEYVLFSAHMDHEGVGRPIDGDSIYNGADDNASGTVTVMEVAGAFASLRKAPRRSLVFLLVSGEEKGMLGSKWFVEHPAVPIDRIVADINLDMLGRNWVDTIAAIGKQESSLGPLAERIAAERPELGMTVVDDQWPGESFYTRSDHYMFARKGVPILFFFNGTHADYHRPSDEADRIDYEKMARIGRLAFFLGLDVANADERPAWDPDAYDRVVERPRS